MTIRTHARPCPRCKRVLFTTRDGLWPKHYPWDGAPDWCWLSGRKAPLPKGPAPRMGAVTKGAKV